MHYVGMCVYLHAQTTHSCLVFLSLALRCTHAFVYIRLFNEHRHELRSLQDSNPRDLVVLGHDECQFMQDVLLQQCTAIRSIIHTIAASNHDASSPDPSRNASTSSAAASSAVASAASSPALHLSASVHASSVVLGKNLETNFPSAPYRVAR
jgi:hypothetical protein